MSECEHQFDYWVINPVTGEESRHELTCKNCGMTRIKFLEDENETLKAKLKQLEDDGK